MKSPDDDRLQSLLDTLAAAPVPARVAPKKRLMIAFDLYPDGHSVRRIDPNELDYAIRHPEEYCLSDVVTVCYVDADGEPLPPKHTWYKRRPPQPTFGQLLAEG